MLWNQRYQAHLYKGSERLCCGARDIKLIYTKALRGCVWEPVTLIANEKLKYYRLVKSKKDNDQRYFLKIKAQLCNVALSLDLILYNIKLYSLQLTYIIDLTT